MSAVNKLSSQYRKCSNEGQQCFTGKNNSIAFMAADGSGPIFYRISSDGEIDCNISTFGDPSPNKPKVCYAMSIPTDIQYADGIPINLTPCSYENNICNPTGGNTYDLLYGRNGRYSYANITGSISCNDQTLGNPSPKYNDSIRKQCYYRPNISPNENIPTNIIVQPAQPTLPATNKSNFSTTIITIIILAVVILFFGLILSTFRERTYKKIYIYS